MQSAGLWPYWMETVMWSSGASAAVSFITAAFSPSGYAAVYVADVSTSIKLPTAGTLVKSILALSLVSPVNNMENVPFSSWSMSI